jgi:hypothetical protein
MKLPQTGGCRCGALRYEITQTPQLVYVCHCTDCQRITTSAFSMSLVLPVESFHLLAGVPQMVQRVSKSGYAQTSRICPKCGLRVCSGPNDSSVRNVKAGTLDDTSWLRPTVHFWTRSKQPWVMLPEDVESFETQPADPIGFLYSRPT